MPCSMLSKLVAFDTHVYMNHNHTDAKVIMQALHAWSLISPPIVILVPFVSFRLCLALCPSASPVSLHSTPANCCSPLREIFKRFPAMQVWFIPSDAL